MFCIFTLMGGAVSLCDECVRRGNALSHLLGIFMLYRGVGERSRCAPAKFRPRSLISAGFQRRNLEAGRNFNRVPPNSRTSRRRPGGRAGGGRYYFVWKWGVAREMPHLNARRCSFGVTAAGCLMRWLYQAFSRHAEGHF